MSTETILWIAVVALIAWNGFQQSLLRYHRAHLAAIDGRADAHQRSLDAHSQHLATHDEALRLRSITPISAARLSRFEREIAESEVRLRKLEES